MTFVSHSFPGGSRTGELIAMDSGRLNHFGRRTSVFFRDFGFSPLLKILVPPPFHKPLGGHVRQGGAHAHDHRWCAHPDQAGVPPRPGCRLAAAIIGSVLYRAFAEFRQKTLALSYLPL